MLRFISFGSGSSGNCYCLMTDTESIIIDAGIGLRSLKKMIFEYHVNLAFVKAILITHDHADHIKSVGVLSRDLNIPVYTTSSVHEGINANYFVKHKIPAERAKVITPNEPFTVGSFTVTPIPVPHDSHGCVGFFVEAEGTNFCLLTDVGLVSPETGAYISRTRHLVIESNYDKEMLAAGPYPQYLKERIASGNGHLSNVDCAEALVAYATPMLRHVWLCHLSQENNHPELARLTIEHHLREHGIVPGVDFQLDVLKRKSVCGIYELD